MDVAALIRECRRVAGLTQRELARRARTSQPALARYERGRTTPSLATLERILAATGRRLTWTLEDLPPATSPVSRRLHADRDLVRRVLADHGVEHARVFGSVARGEDTPTSDLDLLVEMPDATLVRLAALRADLEERLGVPIDVTVAELLTDEARRAAVTEAVPL